MVDVLLQLAAWPQVFVCSLSQKTVRLSQGKPRFSNVGDRTPI